ncbi:NUMOD3 domain-containing DNA-binding protein [Mycoplana ramosa]|uniref:NUMOD3 domain-containing DNA-binding protein n=1 Tax=Mycoplana ramosa TaxID=40837 RepID=A0ABW3YR24_MYCRA
MERRLHVSARRLSPSPKPSTSAQGREWQHFNNLSNNRHPNILLQDAYNEFGESALVFEILELASIDELHDLENRYLDECDNLYNISKKANGGSYTLDEHPYGEEIRRKTSGENNHWHGKKHTPEARKKMQAQASGENGWMFSGYYLTPWGRFASTLEADKASNGLMSHETIRNVCKNPDREITTMSYAASKYVRQNYDKSIIGKRYSDIGFGFEAATSPKYKHDQTFRRIKPK